MPVLVNSIQIGAPADRVFDYVSTMENELEWNPKVITMERLTSTPLGVGSQYRAEWPGSGKSLIEITTIDRPRSWTAYATGRGLDIAFKGEVAELAHGARLTITMDLRPKGVLKLASPLLARAMQRTEERNLANLKRTIEAREAPAPV